MDASRFTHCTASSSVSMESSREEGVHLHLQPTQLRSPGQRPVRAAPAMAPRVPPVAMKPKSRLPWPSDHMSGHQPQNTETTKRLKTLSQT